MVPNELLLGFFTCSVHIVAVVFCPVYTVNFHCNSWKNFQLSHMGSHHATYSCPNNRFLTRRLRNFAKRSAVVKELSPYSLVPDKSTKCAQKSPKNWRTTHHFHNSEPQVRSSSRLLSVAKVGTKWDPFRQIFPSLEHRQLNAYLNPNRFVPFTSRTHTQLLSANQSIASMSEFVLLWERDKGVDCFAVAIKFEERFGIRNSFQFERENVASRKQVSRNISNCFLFKIDTLMVVRTINNVRESFYYSPTRSSVTRSSYSCEILMWVEINLLLTRVERAHG